MQTIHIETLIHAPAARCFDLARSVDAHVQSAASTGERAVGGVTSGLLGLGDEVTWEAPHFGVRQRLTSRITAFDRPAYFQDRMTAGPFKHLEHEHRFESADAANATMIDTLHLTAPGGILARPIEYLLLAPHLTRFLKHRGQALKAMAESEDWEKFVLAG